MPTTNYNPRYDFVNFLAEYDITSASARLFDPGAVEQAPDFLDQNLVELMYSLRLGGLYTVRQYESLTTIVYNAYGNTTLWWVVLMFNGLETSMQLQPGMQLKLPTLDSINAALAVARKPEGAGVVVTI